MGEGRALFIWSNVGIYNIYGYQFCDLDILHYMDCWLMHNKNTTFDPYKGLILIEKGEDYEIYLTPEKRAKYRLVVDGLEHWSCSFRLLEYAQKEVERDRIETPKRLDHLLRAAGFEIYYEADVYYWCAKFNGKVYKSFMKDYDLGLKSILKQWKKDRQNGTSDC